jgi:hypothetical protein
MKETLPQQFSSTAMTMATSPVCCTDSKRAR